MTFQFGCGDEGIVEAIVVLRGVGSGGCAFKAWAFGGCIFGGCSFSGCVFGCSVFGGNGSEGDSSISWESRGFGSDSKSYSFKLVALRLNFAGEWYVRRSYSRHWFASATTLS